MEKQDTRDIVEAVIMTALCSAAAMLVAWAGKKYLDISPCASEVHVHNYLSYDGDEDCDCEKCKDSKERGNED